MKKRQAWKIYSRFFSGDYNTKLYKLNTYMTAVRKVSKTMFRECEKNKKERNND